MTKILVGKLLEDTLLSEKMEKYRDNIEPIWELVKSSIKATRGKSLPQKVRLELLAKIENYLRGIIVVLDDLSNIDDLKLSSEILYMEGRISFFPANPYTERVLKALVKCFGDPNGR